MKRLVAGLLMSTVAGCTTVPPAEAEEVPVRWAGKCEAAKAQALIGRASGPDVGREALRLTGARAVRWIPEGGIVTMEFREDRVNLYLDGKHKVVRVVCG